MWSEGPNCVITETHGAVILMSLDVHGGYDQLAALVDTLGTTWEMLTSYL